jgi:hypothetical protein
MKYFQSARPALMGIVAAFALTLSAFSSLAIADELKLKLSGDMEVPPVKTSAQGDADIAINHDMTVSGKIVTSGIAGTMAHIHNGKLGSNGPVIVTLRKNGDNGWIVPAGSKLSKTDLKAFIAGELYVNVHSAENKGGEIRGQLTPTMPMTHSK